ncbi:hypothetical protein FSARC_14213 [Fusarium sarcochroum]|uniref:Xylanolytic transcriptional activator regulatory domain-containing protein n=1 Tax=Fusarium sarcochroum TaxID=1208366 RepID=A0A8H4WQR6_9HYPO|nr:hypothetical protein FSARC_14213 [Fusarium sarcochroum]
MEHSKKPAPKSKPSRKRSLQACLACRSRKMIKDANCLKVRLLGGDRNQEASRIRAPPFAGQPTTSSTQQSLPTTADVHSPLDSIVMPEAATSHGSLQSTVSEDPWQICHMGSLNCNPTFGPTCLKSPAWSMPWDQQFSTGSLGEQLLVLYVLIVSDEGIGGATSTIVEASSLTGPTTFPLKADTRTESVVLYSSYQFLTVGNIHAIPHQDVNYLETQGCLHIPTRSILDAFVRGFFVHVHVFLPLLDEGDFWEMYCPTTNPAPKTKMSLLVLQAMLFASCNFVPLPILHQMGHRDVCAARASFYRKAKLLYNMEIESAHLPLAQSALLLMGWVPDRPSNTMPVPYKTWLGLGLHHAKHINAHRENGVCDVPSSTCSAEDPHSNTLRRLWWCCIIMDRLSPLCTRFRLQITSDLFDFEHCVPLGFVDLQTEVYRSKVFHPSTKLQHIAIFSKFLGLLMALTEVLPIVFPFENKLESGTESLEEEANKIERCGDLLRNWYKTANADFPLFDGHDADQRSDELDHTNSIILYTNLMYIYYYTSCITLCNRRIFSQVATSRCAKVQGAETHKLAGNLEIRGDIEVSVVGLTKCIGALTRCRLTDRLPITVLACMAIPLALYVVTARLSSLDRELAPSHFDNCSETDLALNQTQLDVLIKAVDTLLPEYYGAEWIKDTARHAANLAQSYNQLLLQSGQEAMRDWGHILAMHPVAYLRLTWTVDLCISRRRSPETQDFPPCLRNGLDEPNRVSLGANHDATFSQSFGRSQASDKISESDFEKLWGTVDPSIDLSWDRIILENTQFDEAETNMAS